jgi:hypothetical protein
MLLRRCAALTLAVPVILALPASAHAAPVKVFKNCTAVHAVYKGGIAKPGAKDKRKSGHAHFKPRVSAALYKANKAMDRDKDGIACEQ